MIQSHLDESVLFQLETHMLTSEKKKQENFDIKPIEDIIVPMLVEEGRIHYPKNTTSMRKVDKEILINAIKEAFEDKSKALTKDLSNVKSLLEQMRKADIVFDIENIAFVLYGRFSLENPKFLLKSATPSDRTRRMDLCILERAEGQRFLTIPIDNGLGRRAKNKALRDRIVHYVTDKQEEAHCLAKLFSVMHKNRCFLPLSIDVPAAVNKMFYESVSAFWKKKQRHFDRLNDEEKWLMHVYQHLGTGERRAKAITLKALEIMDLFMPATNERIPNWKEALLENLPLLFDACLAGINRRGVRAALRALKQWIQDIKNLPAKRRERYVSALEGSFDAFNNSSKITWNNHLELLSSTKGNRFELSVSKVESSDSDEDEPYSYMSKSKSGWRNEEVSVKCIFSLENLKLHAYEMAQCKQQKKPYLGLMHKAQLRALYYFPTLKKKIKKFYAIRSNEKPSGISQLLDESSLFEFMFKQSEQNAVKKKDKKEKEEKKKEKKKSNREIVEKAAAKYFALTCAISNTDKRAQIMYKLLCHQFKEMLGNKYHRRLINNSTAITATVLRKLCFTAKNELKEPEEITASLANLAEILDILRRNARAYAHSLTGGENERPKVLVKKGKSFAFTPAVTASFLKTLWLTEAKPTESTAIALCRLLLKSINWEVWSQSGGKRSSKTQYDFDLAKVPNVLWYLQSLQALSTWVSKNKRNPNVATTRVLNSENVTFLKKVVTAAHKAGLSDKQYQSLKQYLVELLTSAQQPLALDSNVIKEALIDPNCLKLMVRSASMTMDNGVYRALKSYFSNPSFSNWHVGFLQKTEQQMQLMSPQLAQALAKTVSLVFWHYRGNSKVLPSTSADWIWLDRLLESAKEGKETETSLLGLRRHFKIASELKEGFKIGGATELLTLIIEQTAQKRNKVRINEIFAALKEPSSCQWASRANLKILLQMPQGGDIKGRIAMFSKKQGLNHTEAPVRYLHIGGTTKVPQREEKREKKGSSARGRKRKS